MSERSPGLTRDGKWVGASVRRREDPRLLTGRGRFVDDIHITGMLHAQFVRSSIAMGRVLHIDLDRVREVPGVVAAFTADDLDLLDITPVIDRSPEEFALVSMPVLARDTVRFVGETA
jgi:carbon-monoxide dehydrogenase large subunit